MQKWVWIYGLQQAEIGILHSETGISCWDPFLTPGKRECPLAKSMQNSMSLRSDKTPPSHLMWKLPFLHKYIRSKGGSSVPAPTPGPGSLEEPLTYIKMNVLQRMTRWWSRASVRQPTRKGPFSEIYVYILRSVPASGSPWPDRRTWQHWGNPKLCAAVGWMVQMSPLRNHCPATQAQNARTGFSAARKKQQQNNPQPRKGVLAILYISRETNCL